VSDRLRLMHVEPEYRGGFLQDLRELARQLLFDEYRAEWDLSEISDEERESFRQHPEGYLRNYLLENGFPHPINGLALVGESEACLRAAAQIEISHQLFPRYSVIVVR
jgi:hypothetical protein